LRWCFFFLPFDLMTISQKEKKKQLQQLEEKACPPPPLPPFIFFLSASGFSSSVHPQLARPPPLLPPPPLGQFPLAIRASNTTAAAAATHFRPSWPTKFSSVLAQGNEGGLPFGSRSTNSLGK
jgi:hypothetical protein